MKQEIIASLLAHNFHEGQMYGEERYVAHLSRVYTATKRAGGDDEQQAVAWLHDIIEDTDCTETILLGQGLTIRVVAAVNSITKVKGERYEDYINKVRNNPDALFIKKMDTLDNLTNSLMDSNSARIKKYARQLLLLEE